jgi:hypothetical protein
MHAHAQLCHMLETACEGLTITPEQLRQELKEGGDIPDLQSDALTPHGSRLVAETLAPSYSGPANDDAAREARRQQVLSMLAQGPEIQYAITTDDDAEPDAVILALGIRDKGTCEMRIPKG